MLHFFSDYLKKRLYYAYFLNKKIKKKIYVFSYFPTMQAENYYSWERKALSYAAQLVAMPSAFKVIKPYQLQAPQIYIVMCRVITITFLNQLFTANSTSCLINNRWYAFFLFLELNKYSFIQNLCEDAQTKNKNKLLLMYRLKKTRNK